jgi:hypothetical protein
VGGFGPGQLVILTFLFLMKFKLLFNAKFDYPTLPSILSKFSIVAPQV